MTDATTIRDSDYLAPPLAADRKLLATCARSSAAHRIAKAAGASATIFTEHHRAAAFEILDEHYSASDQPLALPALALRLGKPSNVAVTEIEQTPPCADSEVAEIVTELRADEDKRTRDQCVALATTCLARGNSRDARRYLDQFDDLTAAIEGRATSRRPAYVTLDQQILQAYQPFGERTPTGYPTLDKALRGGLPASGVIGLLGAPGAGKTTVATSLALQLEQAGLAVCILASDEPAAGLITRIGQGDGFSRDELEQTGHNGDAVRARFAERSVARRIVVVDPDAHESMRSIEDAERAIRDFACDLSRVLIIDSIQTAHCDAAAGLESARDRIDAKMQVLKAIAKRGCLVVIISEMSRAAYRSGDRNQDISALASGKESGSIEYGCSLLLGLRSVKGLPGVVDVEVAKNRFGAGKPEFRLRLDFETARFAEIERLAADPSREDASERRASDAQQKVLMAITRHPGELTSKNKVQIAAKVQKAAALAAIDELMIAHRIFVDSTGAYKISPTSEVSDHGN